MARKPERPKDDPESQRFKDAAKELEAGAPKALDRALKKVASAAKLPAISQEMIDCRSSLVERAHQLR